MSERRYIIIIYADENLIKDLSISNNAIAVYCMLRSIIRQDQLEYVVTINQLLFQCTGKNKFSRYDKSSFVSGLKELVEKGIITAAHSFSSSEKILNLSSITIPKRGEKKFTTIEMDEIKTIINSCSTNRYSILRYFILLVGTFHPNISVSLSETDKVYRVVSLMPISHFCKITGLSKSTILSYNKSLEDLKLLYIYHASDFYHTSDKTIKSPPNVYGRFCNKEYVIQFVKNSAEYHGYEKHGPKALANHKRRLAQKYNQIVAGRIGYTLDEIKEVYDYIIAQNEDNKNKYDKYKWEPYKEKIRNTTKLEEMLNINPAERKEKNVTHEDN